MNKKKILLICTGGTIASTLKKDGYARVEVDGQIYDLSDEIKLDKNLKHVTFLCYLRF